MISAGLATKDGERFLRATLESLLAQPLDEIVIGDNASTDGTEDICREYAARDRRIVYVRGERDEGPAANFNRVFSLSHGVYFMWAADHDLWNPTYVSDCMRWLCEYPGRVLAWPRTVIIDAQGSEVMEAPGIDLSQESALARYRTHLATLGWGNAIYGLIRREALERTGLLRPVVGPDLLVLGELALIGPFQQAYGATFYRREARAETREQRAARHASEFAGDHRMLRDLHLQAVRHSSMSLPRKALATIDTLLTFRRMFGV